MIFRGQLGNLSTDNTQLTKAVIIAWKSKYYPILVNCGDVDVVDRFIDDIKEIIHVISDMTGKDLYLSTTIDNILFCNSSCESKSIQYLLNKIDNGGLIFLTWKRGRIPRTEEIFMKKVSLLNVIIGCDFSVIDLNYFTYSISIIDQYFPQIKITKDCINIGCVPLVVEKNVELTKKAFLEWAGDTTSVTILDVKCPFCLKGNLKKFTCQIHMSKLKFT